MQEEERSGNIHERVESDCEKPAQTREHNQATTAQSVIRRPEKLMRAIDMSNQAATDHLRRSPRRRWQRDGPCGAFSSAKKTIFTRSAQALPSLHKMLHRQKVKG